MRHHQHHHDDHHEHHHTHLRGPQGHGRHRARRGAVGRSILTLLAEHPMNGYELINELAERSGGRWKPSSGAIYPALRRLEDRGFVTSTDDDGKSRFEITESGRERLNGYGDETPPWEGEIARHGEIRAAIAELIGPARQIGRFGSPKQIAAAAAALQQATTTMYRILADGAGDDESEPASE
jgi:DNA-binding PadR family transcriptional regulator